MPFTMEVQTMGDGWVGSDVLSRFLYKAAPKSKDSHRLILAAALMELLRLSGAEAPDPRAAREAMAEAAARLAKLDFSGLTFSVTRAVRSDMIKDIFAETGVPEAQRDGVTLEALRQFVNAVQMEPAVSSQELLQQLVAEAAIAEVAEEAAAPVPAPSPVAPPQLKRAPEIVQNKNLLGVFQPVKFKAEGSPLVELLSWQSEYPNGRGLGPQLAALGIDIGNEVKILTETGEFVWLPHETFLLAKAAPEDYAAVPPMLLANARICAPWNWPTVDGVGDSLYNARFGRFTQPETVATYSSEFVSPLQDVFDQPGNYPPGSSVAVTLSVDGSPYSVTLDARVSKTGPYVTAKLLDANENVVMRLDTPRQFSPRGVYLFPLQDAAVALLVF